MRYDIVVVGFHPHARLKPAEALQGVLGLSPDASRGLIQAFPAVVLRGVSQNRAERVSQQLSEAGAKVELRESRLSQAAQGEDALAFGTFPTSAYSGNYEIGEILAPVPRPSAASVSAAAAARPAEGPPKRPRREERDSALRESFRPDARVAPSAGGEHDAAFAGLTNFGDDMDGFGGAAARLEVDEVALASIRRRPDSGVGAGPKLSLAQRLLRSLSRAMGSLGEWGIAFLSLAVIASITLFVVGYALDPANPLGAVRSLPAYARSMFEHAR